MSTKRDKAELKILPEKLCKKSELEELFKIMLWTALFVLLLTGVYFLFKRLGS